ncbi:MAG: tyrosine-type recombinase/integrase [Propionibacteriaceae bacterium]|nr:tyrosine-type recombinase/integrase [Propionibacteriaceae bacterium]
MAVQDLWFGPDKRPTARHGRGKRWRVVVPGHPTKAFATRFEAVAWERQLQRTPAVRTSGLTVGACVAAYLDGRRHLSPRYRSALAAAAAHVLAEFGPVRCSDVTRSRIQAWLAGLESGKGRAMAPRSRARVLQVLRLALDVAVDRGEISANPAVGVSPGRGAVRLPTFLNLAQLQALAEATSTHAPMVWLLGTTGLRLGECRRLDVDDVDVARSRLLVRQAKSGRGREVPITAKVLAMLDLGDGRRPLFVGPRGARINTDNWRARVFRSAREKAGLPGLRIHDLRHTAASLMVASGATVKDVQAALGHASAAMTLDVYAHLFDGGLDTVGERMSALLSTVPDSYRTTFD